MGFYSDLEEYPKKSHSLSDRGISPIRRDDRRGHEDHKHRRGEFRGEQIVVRIY